MKDSFTLEQEKIIIEKALKAGGRNAYKYTRKQGFPVTVLRGNKICRIDSQGIVSVLSEVRQAEYKVKKRKFQL